MVTKKNILQFETSDGTLFATEEAAIAHELQVNNYDASSKEIIELLTKAQLMLDTKHELSELKDYLNDEDSRLELILDAIRDFNDNTTNGEDYQSSEDYYSSKC